MTGKRKIITKEHGLLQPFDTKEFLSKVHPTLAGLNIHCDKPKQNYEEDIKMFNELFMSGRLDEFHEQLATYCLNDFFAFCFMMLRLPVDHPFLMARIYEQAVESDGCIDLWAREHWKSTIGTFALSIWRTLHNPENRTCIFSFKRSIALSLMRKIKVCLERNTLIQDCYPDILYHNPKKESSKWTEIDGFCVKREGVSYGESTFEAWGLIENMPTSKHFPDRVYDDVVDPNTVTSQRNIEKANEAFKMSDNLGDEGGTVRVYGTRYKMNDPYSEMMESGLWKVRVYPAEVDEDGEPKRGGIPVYMTKERLQRKFDISGPYIYSCQMLQFPVDATTQSFHPKWFSTYDVLPSGKLNYYITVDSGNRPHKFNVGYERKDPTVMIAFCVDGFRNTFILDIVRDKLDLQQKWEALRDLSQKWGISVIGYEQYGNMTDGEHMELASAEEGVYLDIIPLGGKIKKTDRILTLVPEFKNRKIKFPKAILYRTVEGKYVNIVDQFIEEEYLGWPFSKKDDIFDCLARKNDRDLGVVYPVVDHSQRPKNRYKNDPFDLDKDDVFYSDTDHESWEIM